MSTIIPTAEPFLFPGEQGKPGCLLIHGFTGAPKEMRWLGEYLNTKGMHCLGVRLSGHATQPEDMIRSRYTDWINSVVDGYHMLCDFMRLSNRGEPERIYLLGLSMGGALALLMSTKLQVAGVVAMSTPYRLPYDLPVWMVRVLSLFLRYQPLGKEEPGASWFDQSPYEENVSYLQNPVRSIAEVQVLIANMRAALPRVKAPVLLVHSRNDTYIVPENMEHIYANLGTADKAKLYVSEAGHVITRDADRGQVFEAASAFIQRIETAA
jgi:carboxylesterase